MSGEGPAPPPRCEAEAEAGPGGAALTSGPPARTREAEEAAPGRGRAPGAAAGRRRRSAAWLVGPLGGRSRAGSGRRLGPVQAAPRGRGPPRPAPPRARLRAREAWPAACAPPPPRVSRGGAGKPGAWEREPPRRTAAAAARWRRSRGRPAASRARVGTRLRRLPERRKPPRAAPPSADERTCAASEALAARVPLKPGADGTCAEPGPNVLKSSEGDLGMCPVGTVLVWCLRRPGFDSCVLLWLYSQHSESGGWRFKSSRSSRLIGSQPGMRILKKERLKGRFLLTPNSSSVLFLNKPLMERGALDTGVTHPSHRATVHHVHADSKPPSASSRKGKLNSIVSFFFFSFKEYFYSLTVSCMYTMYRDHNTPFFHQSQTQAHVM